MKMKENNNSISATKGYFKMLFILIANIKILLKNKATVWEYSFNLEEQRLYK